MVEVLVQFLKTFEEATRTLEGDSTPTIQHVNLWYKKLIGCMQAPPNAIPIVKFLHKRGLEAITCKFEITRSWPCFSILNSSRYNHFQLQKKMKLLLWPKTYWILLQQRVIRMIKNKITVIFLISQ